MFKPGDKVICVDDDDVRNYITKNDEYVVKVCIGSVLILECSDSISFSVHRFKLKEKEVNKLTPHEHHDLIVAWAKGAKIQIKHRSDWVDLNKPTWNEDHVYRIKPEEITFWHIVYRDGDGHTHNSAGYGSKATAEEFYKNYGTPVKIIPITVEV